MTLDQTNRNRIPRVWRLLSLVAALWGAGALRAQPTTTLFTLSFAVKQSDNLFYGTGTATPFGDAAITVTFGQQPIPVTVILSDGDQMVAEATQFVGGPNTPDQASGRGNIIGGTGAFSGATGQLSFTVMLGVNGWGLEGSGTVTTTAPVTTTPPVPPPATVSGYQQVDCDGAQLSGVPVSQPALLPGSPFRPPSVTAKLAAILAAPYILCPPLAGLLTIPQQPQQQDMTQDAPGKQQAEQIQNQMLQTASGKELSSSPPDTVMEYNLLNMIPILRSTAPIRNAATAGPTTPTTNLHYVLPASSSAAHYTVTATCADTVTNCWATTAALGGTIPANTLGDIPVAVSPGGLAAGTYKARVSITTGGGAATTATIRMAVNADARPFFLSNTGLQFQAASGVPGAQTGTISVVSQPDNPATFTATASTLAGGNWLMVSPASGNLTAAGAAPVSIQADPAGLAPGIYYGAVDFASPGGSIQRVQVGLTVTDADAAAPVLSPSGLVFVTTVGSNPAARRMTISNPGSQPFTVSMQAAFGSTTGWLTASPGSQTVAPGQPLSETITVNSAGLGAGSYLATLNVKVVGTGTETFPVEVLLIVQPAAGASCVPTKLFPVFTSLANQFRLTSGLPYAVNLQIVDDCGNPMLIGSGAAYFPDGDPTSPLLPLGGGNWTATWMPQAGAGRVATVGVVAGSADGSLGGTAAITGTLAANASAPAISSGGVVSAASIAAQAPLPVSPGEFISIFGSNLSDTPGGVSNLPYPLRTASTQVLLGGEPLPIEYAGDGLINAIVPYDAAVNTSMTLVVARNGAYSLPQTVLVSAAQPTVFTQDQSGSGAGAVLTLNPATGAVDLNTVAAPAKAGDILEVYCTGLGAVSPAIPAGVAAPLDSLSRTTNTVTATIGSQAAQVLFAGLAPGFSGLYQVNVLVPDGAGTGPAVPLVLTEAGLASPPVTVAIQ